MNQEQLLSIFRQVLLVAGGGLVTKGYVDQGTLATVVGAVLALGTSAWGIWTRRPAGLVASAAAQSQVSKIITTPNLASSVTSSKVVGPLG